MLLRDELEDLRMTAQQVQARVEGEGLVGRVIVKPELILELIEAYEQLLQTAEPHEPKPAPAPYGRPFKW